MREIIQVISAFLGSGGFAMVFNVRVNLIFYASLGGGLGWVIFLLIEKITHNYFIACFVASAFCALYGEIMARIKKTPASVFFIPSVVPLIPGGALFYTMSYTVRSDFSKFSEYSSLTVQYALGIACGISLTWAVWYMCQKFITDIIIKKRADK